MLHQPSIEISGNSGCTVRLLTHDQRIMVEKECALPSYIPRLQAQIRKQNDFRHALTNPAIIVPELYDEADNPGLYSARMEFLPYLNFIDFLGVCSVPALMQSIKAIEGFIDHNLRTEYQTVNTSALLKLDEISRNVSGEPHKQEIDQLFGNKLRDRLTKKEINIPNGWCHGDFTLSNIVFSANGNCIGLFDFLDSYIDSPIMDLVKLRQDTHLHWSLTKSKKPFSHLRVCQGLRQLDLFTKSKLSALGISGKEYNILQSVNVLRILPYANDTTTLNFIQTSLKTLED